MTAADQEDADEPDAEPRSSRGIAFVSAVTGERRAALSAGPQVWIVAEAWLQHDKQERTPAIVADAMGLTVVEVETALAYWAGNLNEINDLISRHHASQDEALAAWNGGGRRLG